MPLVLIVEDERQIARVLQLDLCFEGFETVVSHTRTDRILQFHDGKFDLALLDVTLPEMNVLLIGSFTGIYFLYVLVY